MALTSAGLSTASPYEQHTSWRLTAKYQPPSRRVIKTQPQTRPCNRPAPHKLGTRGGVVPTSFVRAKLSQPQRQRGAHRQPQRSSQQR
eukprot:6180481-Prymnesium_polylepis.2